MKPSFINLIVIWALAKSSAAWLDSSSRFNPSEFAAMGARNALPEEFDPTLDPDYDPNFQIDPELDPGDEWDEDLAVRDLMSEVFEHNDAVAHRLSRRAPQEGWDVENAPPIDIISFNIHPDVGDDDPYELRKNPARDHMEFLCNWRSPREGFDLLKAFEMFEAELKDPSISADLCSGPNNFCTRVYCRDGYNVEVCSFGTAPWEVRCTDFLDMARDTIMAMANQDLKIWEHFFDAKKRSKQQETNDRKKLCITHSVASQPETLGIAFWNRNSRYLVRTSYGYPDERLSCTKQGIQDDVHRASASQEQYLKVWYDRLTLKDIEDEDGEEPPPKPGVNEPKPGIKDPKGGNKTETAKKTSKGRLFVPKGSPNDTDPFGLPFYEDPTGTYPTRVNITARSGYRGPSLKDFDPASFLPPGVSLPTSKAKGPGGTKEPMKPVGAKPNAELSMGDDGGKDKKKGGKAPKPTTTASRVSFWQKPKSTRTAPRGGRINWGQPQTKHWTYAKPSATKTAGGGRKTAAAAATATPTTKGESNTAKEQSVSATEATDKVKPTSVSETTDERKFTSATEVTDEPKFASATEATDKPRSSSKATDKPRSSSKATLSFAARPSLKKESKATTPTPAASESKQTLRTTVVSETRTTPTPTPKSEETLRATVASEASTR